MTAAVHGQRGAGVAGRGAGGPLGADHVGVRERGGHAVVFEAARGVHPLVLQEQLPGVEADVLGRRRRPAAAASALRRW